MSPSEETVQLHLNRAEYELLRDCARARGRALSSQAREYLLRGLARIEGVDLEEALVARRQGTPDRARVLNELMGRNYILE